MGLSSLHHLRGYKTQPVSGFVQEVHLRAMKGHVWGESSWAYQLFIVRLVETVYFRLHFIISGVIQYIPGEQI